MKLPLIHFFPCSVFAFCFPPVDLTRIISGKSFFFLPCYAYLKKCARVAAGSFLKSHPVNFNDETRENGFPCDSSATSISLLPFVLVSCCTPSELTDTQRSAGTGGRFTDMNISHPAKTQPPSPSTAENVSRVWKGFNHVPFFTPVSTTST